MKKIINFNDCSTTDLRECPYLKHIFTTDCPDDPPMFQCCLLNINKYIDVRTYKLKANLFKKCPLETSVKTMEVK